MKEEERKNNFFILSYGGIGAFLLVRGIAMLLSGLWFNGFVASAFGYGMVSQVLGLPPFKDN